MQIGWCRPLADADLLARLGFDYIELPLAAFGLQDADSVRAAKAAVRGAPLPTAAFNYFFPRDLRVVGPDVDAARIRAYLARVAELLAAAGAKSAVLGSAWARNVPEGWETARAEAQFLDTLHWCADAMVGTGATVVIEPLYRQESNFINSVAEGVRFAAAVNRPEIRVLADFFHMDEEGEPLTELRAHGAWLAHVHLADTGRRHPGSGAYDYATFRRELAAGGYDARVSAECSLDDAERQMAESLTFLRGLWPQA